MGPAPDLPQPDQCVPPTSCAIDFLLAVQGGEVTAAVEGDFEGIADTWSSRPMTKAGAMWQVSVTLNDAQKLTYKLVVDKGLIGEKWFLDPNNPNTVPGPHGDNSRLTVTCPNPCL